MTEQLISSEGLALLDKALAYIADHPNEWNQASWGMCLASHILRAAGVDHLDDFLAADDVEGPAWRALGVTEWEYNSSAVSDGGALWFTQYAFTHDAGRPDERFCGMFEATNTMEDLRQWRDFLAGEGTVPLRPTWNC